MIEGLYDAHNHLQDARFGPDASTLVEACRREGVRAMVVNGACEEDWPAVRRLYSQFPEVIPSFGYHPWYVRERTGQWRNALEIFLAGCPSAIGEIGLDRWIKDPDIPAQEETLVFQLGLAAERNLPVSIHCLKAWGRLYDLLKAGPRPDAGFVLHSFGGPAEMIPALVKLGAYFSLPGYFAHARKARQREAFTQVPLERLLIETDAPDQPLPDDRVRHQLPGVPASPVAQDSSPGGLRPAALNHPANLRAVYEFAAELLDRPFSDLAGQVEANFLRLFGRFVRPTH